MGLAVKRQQMELGEREPISHLDKPLGHLETKRNSKPTSRRAITAFGLGFVGMVLFVGYVAVGEYLLTEMGVPVPSLVGSTIESVQETVSPGSTDTPPLKTPGEYTTKSSKSSVWNCGGVYTENPRSDKICVLVDVIEGQNANGQRLFTTPSARR